MPGSARVIQVYDISGNVVTMPPQPIIAKRDPTTRDREELGTFWINKTTNSVWCLADVAGVTATWVTSPASGVGTFTSVTVTPGNLALTGAGNITVANGDLTLSNGNVAVSGDVAITGDLSITGNFVMTDADQVTIDSSYNGADAIYLHSNGGANETIHVYNQLGTSATAINVEAAVGGITLSSSKATASAITVNSPAGGMSFNATGSAGKDIIIANTGGSVSVTASEAAADAVVINATDAAGGVQIKAGTGGILIGQEADTTTISVGNIAPTASRAITIGAGTVVTAATTDLISIGVGGATTNADSVKQVNIGTGAVATGQNLVNIATGNRTSGTHTTAISTGTGTKTVSVGNADGLTVVGIDGITSINAVSNAATNINTGASTGSVAIGNAAAGAISIDTAAGISLDSATASNFTVTGAADLTLKSTAGAVLVTSEKNAGSAIYLHANGGTSETVKIHADQGTGVASVDILSDLGGVTITGGKNAATAINLTASDVAGGITVSAGTAGIAQDSTGAISLGAAAASDFTVTGAFDLSLISTAGSVVLDGGEAVADAISISASNAAGGVDINAGTAGATIDSTGSISIDAAGASNFTVTGAADLTLESTLGAVLIKSEKDAASSIYLHADGGVSETVNIHSDQGTSVTSVNIHSDLGGVTLNGGIASANAVNLTASDVAGGMTFTAGTAGVIATTTGAISLGGAAASNLTVTGAFDVTVATTLGSANITAGEAAADAIYLHATDVAGGISATSGTGGLVCLTTGAATIDSSLASHFKITGAQDLTMQSTAGSVIIDGGEAVNDAVQITASDVAGGIHIHAGTGGIHLDAGGDIEVTLATDSQASPTTSATINHRVGFATFTGFTTAAGAEQAFTIANALVTASSAIMVTVSNLGANDAQMTLTRVKAGVGSFVVTTQNNGGAALNGDVSICFWVLN